MKKLLLLLLTIFLFSGIVNAATNTFTGGGDGTNWGDAANWSDTNIPDATDDVVIPADQFVVLNQNGTCLTLTVDAGGQLFRNSSITRFLTVAGTSITCNGVIGNGSTLDAIVFNINAATCTISGSGTFDAYALRKNANNATTTLTIGMNLNLRTTGTAILNNFPGNASAFNVTISGGYTVNVPNGNVCIDGVNGATGAGVGGGGTFTVNGTLNISGTLYLTTDNTAEPACTFAIGATGTVSTANTVTNASATSTHTISIASGGILKFTTGDWGSLSATNNTYTLNAGSTVEFSYAGAQTVGNPGNYSNLTLSGSGVKTLSSVTVTGTLKLAGTATVSGTPTYSGGTATLEYAGSAAQVTTDQEFSGVVNLKINNTSGVNLHTAKTITGTTTINTGCNFNAGGNTYSTGSIANNGTYSGTTTLTITGNPGTISGNGSYPILVINSAGTVTLSSGTTIINSSFTLTGGSFDNNGTIQFANGVSVTRGNGSWAIADAGTRNYSGTIDLDYTGAGATGGELPSSTTALNNMLVGAAISLASSPTVNGTLTLNANLTTTGQTLTIKNPIAGTLSNLQNDGSLTIAGSASSILIPAKTYTTLTINNSNGATLAGNTIATTVTCTLGNLFTTAGYTLTLGTGFTLTEAASKYVVGTLVSPTITDPAAGAFSGMGLTFAGAVTGTNVIVTRNTGSGAAVSVGSNTGINRKFTMAGTGITYNGVVTLAWVADDNNSKNMNNVIVFEYDFTGSQWLARNVTTGIPATPSYSLTSTIATVLSGATQAMFTVSDNGSPLPVELTSFTASVIDEGVKLNWETATEVDNYGFEVERSILGNNEWQTLGFIEGAGVSNSPKQYSFKDENVAVGSYAYRLKQIDLDGAYTYSDQIEVNLETLPTELALEQNYPNPFNPATTIKFALPQSSNVSLVVYNMLGERVAVLENGMLEAGIYERNFDASSFTSGIYVYVLKMDNTQISKKMLLVK
ncbi:MAG: T9SS type A sorting domain-containing protein [bacterium]